MKPKEFFRPGGRTSEAGKGKMEKPAEAPERGFLSRIPLIRRLVRDKADSALGAREIAIEPVEKTSLPAAAKAPENVSQPLKMEFERWARANFKSPKLQKALMDQCPTGNPDSVSVLRFENMSFEIGELAKIIIRFPKIETLNLKGSQFADESEFHYLNESPLQELVLDGTVVTDAIFGFLPASLKSLSLRHTRATPTGKRMLRESCPNLQSLWWTNGMFYWQDGEDFLREFLERK